MTTALLTPHRPPQTLRFGLVALAVGTALILLARLPATREIQTLASVGLPALMLMLSLLWRDHQETRSAGVVRLILIFCATLLFLRYMIWRGTESLPWESGLPSMIFGLMLFGTECYYFLIAVLGHVTTIKTVQRIAPPLPADASLLPDVDVFITTYDEDPELLKTTVIAATQLRYPAQKLRVYVLDDGGTEQMLLHANAARRDAAIGRAKRMKEIATCYGAHYLTRQTNIHAKAGNLNNAMGVTQGEFIIVLDCDHVPAEDFIERTLGFFQKDAQLFLVQTPHNFVTPEPLKRNLSLQAQLPEENEKFYHAIMPGLDYWGSAFFCGSAAMLRRSAMEKIGGFSAATVTEDAETSLAAFSHGYTSVYLDAPLVSGLQPDTFSAFIQQRARWAMGMWQIFWLKNPWRIRGLSFIQRLMFTNFLLYWGFPASCLCLMFMPIIALLWGVTLVDAPVSELLSYCLPTFAGSLIVGQYSYGRFRWPLISYLYEVIQSVHLARSELKLIGNIRSIKFAVTPKAEVRDQDFISGMAKPFYILLILSLSALIAGVMRIIDEPAQRDMLLFISFLALIQFIFLLCALGVTFERKQRRIEPRSPAESSARLKITPTWEQEAELTDASASGAGIVTANHSDLWLAFIHKRTVNLVLKDKAAFDASIQKITQLTEGRVAVGLSYQMHSVENERSAVSIAYGSSEQLKKNLQRCQQRKNAAAVLLILIHKALILGCGHLIFLFRQIRKSSPINQPTPRLLWEKKMKCRQFTSPAVRTLLLAMILLNGSPAEAESVIFSGIEGSSSTRHGYLGVIMPFVKNQPLNDLYKKFVLSSTNYGYQNDERGSQVFIDGRSSGLDAGLGRIWRSHSAVADLSVTIGYRDMKLSPYAPTGDKAGNLLTFNPQLMLWSEVGSGIDTDLLANYATGTASSFIRARIGMHPKESFRIGIERKWLNGRNYALGKTGLFFAFKISPTSHLEISGGREDPEGSRSLTYAGAAISTSF